MEHAAAFELDNRLAVGVIGGDRLQGQVYSFDAATGTLILRRPAHENTNTSDHVTMINVAHITDVKVQEEAKGEIGDVNPVTERDLERREQKAKIAAAKAFQSINSAASPEAQQMFDMLSKTLPCEWDGDCIVVMQQARVSPPYNEGAVVNIGGQTDDAAISRIRRMVADFSQKVAA
uniref:AD domain-containing protein n=1 Tax=Phaeomonas parva TaxID=124430 RepID=A0A6U4EY67_9STRA|mmetsp:Transcript_23059/g.71854  ORF Transcript_23059/g.71854 Transcript_23059/m.71854 type:complete len:177 (+) Transcript_23059:74-604(+)|eukprot:CAMPEP_0118861340 /NCGR_PEP_ID=MMETSP1163-20130328/6904_1 /TAXON_ID=124430 /ORGANISM="Phaeomonas parva, Strain CCMP2877" /LENGTH=176 /DNA_ID=CAMNT_0006795145 /DNA_START=98 /DNA_END=628 /DNA_ORIENTATION=-